MLFTEALTLVQHELPRSKVGAHACAEITAYVDGLNTEFEKMCAEQKDLIANDDSMHQQLLLSSTAVGAHEEMKQKVEELEATLIKKEQQSRSQRQKMMMILRLISLSLILMVRKDAYVLHK